MKIKLLLLSLCLTIFAKTKSPYPQYYLLDTQVIKPSLVADNLKRKLDESAKDELIGKTMAHQSLLDDSVPAAKKNTNKAYFYSLSQEKEALKNNSKENPVKKIVVELGEIKDKKLEIHYKKYIYKNEKWDKAEFKTESVNTDINANSIIDKVIALSLK
jgi:hypothetical protein